MNVDFGVILENLWQKNQMFKGYFYGKDNFKQWPFWCDKPSSK